MKEFEALGAAAASVLLPKLQDRGINVNEGMAVGGAGGRENVLQSERSWGSGGGASSWSQLEPLPIGRKRTRFHKCMCEDEQRSGKRDRPWSYRLFDVVDIVCS